MCAYSSLYENGWAYFDAEQKSVTWFENDLGSVYKETYEINEDDSVKFYSNHDNSTYSIQLINHTYTFTFLDIDNKYTDNSFYKKGDLDKTLEYMNEVDDISKFNYLSKDEITSYISDHDLGLNLKNSFISGIEFTDLDNYHRLIQIDCTATIDGKENQPVCVCTIDVFTGEGKNSTTGEPFTIIPGEKIVSN